MLTLTGRGRLTRRPELRTTSSGSTVTTVAIASSRRSSDEAIYVDLVLWDAQATFAVEHLVKGQAVAFTGRLEPRTWVDRDENARVAIEVHGVELEYGAKPRDARAAEPTDEPAA